MVLPTPESPTALRAYLKLRDRLVEARSDRAFWSLFSRALRVVTEGRSVLLAESQEVGKPSYTYGNFTNLGGEEVVYETEFPGWKLVIRPSPATLSTRAARKVEELIIVARDAMERRHLVSQIRACQSDVSALVDFAWHLSGHADTDSLYPAAFRILHRRHPKLSGYGAVSDPVGRLAIRWRFGRMPAAVKRLDLTETCGGTSGGLMAKQNRKPVFAEIPPGGETFRYENGGFYTLPAENRKFVSVIGARSAAFYPILAWGAVHGVVGLFHPNEEFFSEWNRRVIGGIIATLSRAVERAVNLEEEHRLSEGIRLLSEMTIGSGWRRFLHWVTRQLTAAGAWLLWESRNLGPAFWSPVATYGQVPSLPEILPAAEADSLIRTNIFREGKRGDLIILERDGQPKGMLGWIYPPGNSATVVPLWLPALADHLALTVEDREHHLSLQSAVYRDHLTGLYNRAYLEARLERGDRFRPLAFVILDLDHFKDVNDRNGHDYGDEVLRLIGARLWEGLREEDLAVRLGGDEFVLVLKDLAKDRCLPVLRRIISNLPLDDYSIGVSAGVSFRPEDGESYQDLYRSADRALYAAKYSGRDAIGFPDGKTVASR